MERSNYQWIICRRNGYFDQQQPLCAEHDRISKDLYKEFGVKAGLRDENGKGVLAGLTNISDIRRSSMWTGSSTRQTVSCCTAAMT